MFTILEQPPFVTWREVNIIFEKFHAATDDAKSAILESWLTQSENSKSNLVSALFRQTVKLRESLWSWVVETDAEDEILERLSRVRSATEILNRLLEGLKPFRVGDLGILDWRELFAHLTCWSKWRRPEYYIKTREEELELLKNAAEFVSPDMMNQIFMDLCKLDSHGRREYSEEFLKEIEEIKNRYSRDLADSVIQRFSRPEGIKVFWGDSVFPAEKVIAFNPNSAFHTLEYRKRLVELAARASMDKAIHDNFLVYFQMLTYGATQGDGSFSYSDCQALLRDHEFTKVTWDAAVARPLNLRTVGSLRERIESLKQILGSEINLFSLPAWFKTMEDKYFGPEVDNKK